MKRNDKRKYTTVDIPRSTLDLDTMKRNDKRKYTTVHIPAALAETIDDLIVSERYAYSSRAEFIKDAIRRFVEYYKGI